MATDKNRFDDYLKEHLHRDILFRIAVWGVITAVAVILASREVSFDAVEYFNANAKKLMPQINTLGLAGLLLALPSLILKDLEHVSPSAWGYSTRAGLWGGFIRRLSGDLTLWSIGVFVTIFFGLGGITLSALISGTMNSKDVAMLGAAYFSMIVFIAITGTVNVMIRRAEPPLATVEPFSCVMTSSCRVILVYAVMLLFAAVIKWL